MKGILTNKFFIIPAVLFGLFVFLINLSLITTRVHAQSSTSALSNIHHIFVIVMENKDASSLNPQTAPFIYKILVPAGAYAKNYHNVLPSLGSLHPSEPNYILLEAGTNVFPDHTFTTDNNASSSNSTGSSEHLSALIDKKGLSWIAYQEDMPSGICPINSTGKFASKHDPFIFFKDVSGNPPGENYSYCVSHHKTLTHANFADILQNDLNNGTVANYNFITPNICNDMHDCPISTGDNWLSRIIPIITNSPVYKQDGLILITWDEGGSGNSPIGMIALSPFIKPNYSNNIAYSHASTTKTIENIFQLTPLLGHAADPETADLSDFFIEPIPVSNNISIPTPIAQLAQTSSQTTTSSFVSSGNVESKISKFIRIGLTILIFAGLGIITLVIVIKKWRAKSKTL